MTTALLQANSGAAPINFDDVWTPLLISLALIAAGALTAFDIGGYASASHRNNRGFTSWGRSIHGPAWLSPPYKIIGWLFLICGVPVFVLSVAVLIINS